MKMNYVLPIGGVIRPLTSAILLIVLHQANAMFDFGRYEDLSFTVSDTILSRSTLELITINTFEIHSYSLFLLNSLSVQVQLLASPCVFLTLPSAQKI